MQKTNLCHWITCLGMIVVVVLEVLILKKIKNMKKEEKFSSLSKTDPLEECMKICLSDGSNSDCGKKCGWYNV